MAIKRTQEEFDRIEALFVEEKTSGTEIVACPYCGKMLTKTFSGNSYAVDCEDADCLHYTVRGI